MQQRSTIHVDQTTTKSQIRHIGRGPILGYSAQLELSQIDEEGNIAW